VDIEETSKHEGMSGRLSPTNDSGSPSPICTSTRRITEPGGVARNDLGRGICARRRNRLGPHVHEQQEMRVSLGLAFWFGSEKREMAAGKGTGRAGRPPPTGK
jgi:hypothetical protein